MVYVCSLFSFPIVRSRCAVARAYLQQSHRDNSTTAEPIATSLLRLGIRAEEGQL